MIIALHAATVKPVASSMIARWESYKFGRDCFAAREPLSACRNAEQRRGWYDALNAEAVATLPANCADRLGF